MQSPFTITFTVSKKNLIIYRMVILIYSNFRKERLLRINHNGLNPSLFEMGGVSDINY